MNDRIMVVDDDPSLRFTLLEILMDEGHEVISAEDGYQAIQRTTEGPISLIFMDITMPGINGLEAFMEIKRILPNCTVVMMTGFPGDELIKVASAEGVYTVLQKPIAVEQVLDLIPMPTARR